MKNKITLFFILLVFGATNAQINYVSFGQVEYEKQVNVYQFLGENDPTSLKLRREEAPQFKKTSFTLDFSQNETMYKPTTEIENKPPFFFAEIAYKNKVYTNLKENKTIAYKFAFDKEFIISDSLVKINWKITTDTRMIAGVNCRKAVGIFNESNYIVAFFAENILCSGGPEGITGLPGLILGLAFPSLHITWFATKVELEPKKWKPIEKFNVSKTIKRQELIEKVMETAKTFNMPKVQVLKQITL